MSVIRVDVSLPLDDDGFLRRECPLCLREFKVKPTETELRSMSEESVHALLESTPPPSQEDGERSGASEAWCPYCGQQAPSTSWWTEEQNVYLSVFASNIAARLLNEHFIRPMKRHASSVRGGGLSLQFRGSEMEEREPWISPEPNDMVRYLTCPPKTGPVEV